MLNPKTVLLRILPIVILLSPHPTWSQESAQRVAVLNLDNPAGLPPQEISYLTDLIRGSARENLPANRFMIMTSENILALLGDKPLVECLDDCAVETGRKLGAAYVVAGEVVKFGGGLRLSLELYETKDGGLLKSSQRAGAEVMDLEVPVRELGRELFKPLRPKGRGSPEGEPGPLGSGGSNWQPDDNVVVLVRFESNPAGALVEVDGELLCETPCVRPLPPGTVEVSFKLLRYVPEIRTVTVAEGLGVVSATLTADFAWLSVTSEPSGLQLELDGKPVGVTPLRRLELELGAHEVLVRGQYRHETGERIVLVRGEHRELHLTSSPINGGLLVQAVDRDSNAVSGEVLVDGRSVGRTWTTLTVQTGPHKVEVVSESDRWNSEVTVPVEDVLVINAEFGRTLRAVKSRSRAVWYSLLIPGGGQHYRNRHPKGWMFTTGAALAGGYAFLSEMQARGAIDEYETAHDEYLAADTQLDIDAAYAVMQDKWDEASSQTKQRDLGLYALGGVWLLNVIDAALGWPLAESGVTLNAVPLDVGMTGVAVSVWR